MRQEFEPAHQKVITNPDRRSRLVDNPPVVPQVELRTLRINHFDGGYKRHAGIDCTVQSPLISFREISIGGTRTIGGGASREATRKAKRKGRR
jgi:hypothetical protein